MKENFKFILVILFSSLLILSCSRLKEKMNSLTGENESKKKEQTITEKTLNVSTTQDLNFYNKYIEVSNELSAKVEDINKSYYSEIPEPTSIKPNSMIFTISFGVQLTMLESEIKKYKRSLFDNGELSKLSADDKALKTTVETDFKDLLSKVADLHQLCSDIDSYYKNKEFKTDPAKAKKLDYSYKDKYKLYDDSYKTLKNDLRELKPVVQRKDPETITNPDEKTVVMLQNGYEDLLEKMESVYGKFDKIKQGTDPKELKSSFDDLDRFYQDFDKKIASTAFSDRTKYMKYNYEDYFSKMYVIFSRKMSYFIDNIKSGKLTAKEFASKYDEVLTSYNNLITAYNSSINTMNSFKIH